jgi:hypothetical protein
MPVADPDRFLNSFPNAPWICFPCAQAKDRHLIIIVE